MDDELQAIADEAERQLKSRKAADDPRAALKLIRRLVKHLQGERYVRPPQG